MSAVAHSDLRIFGNLGFVADTLLGTLSVVARHVKSVHPGGGKQRAARAECAL
jgi:hypothetical protein